MGKWLQPVTFDWRSANKERGCHANVEYPYSVTIPLLSRLGENEMKVN